MIDDLLKSAKESIAERLASPLIASFVVAWCGWNYKFLVILFSSAGVAQTFRLIDTIAFPDLETSLLRGIAYPLASALAYIFVYPYPARAIYEFTLRRQREISQLRQKIDEETPLTLEESRRVRAEFYALERKHREVEDRLNSEITELKASLERAQQPETKGFDATDASPKMVALAPLQFQLLKILEESEGTATESALISKSSAPRVQTEFSIGELVRQGLIETGYDQDGMERTYLFTHEGRRALINDGHVSPPTPRSTRAR